MTTNTPGLPARTAAISALSLNEVFPGDTEVGTAVRVQIEPMRERVGVLGDVGRVHNCESGNVVSTALIRKCGYQFPRPRDVRATGQKD